MIIDNSETVGNKIFAVSEYVTAHIFFLQVEKSKKPTFIAFNAILMGYLQVL